MTVCVLSISRLTVEPALPMIIPDTKLGSRNFTKASSLSSVHAYVQEDRASLEFLLHTKEHQPKMKPLSPACP